MRRTIPALVVTALLALPLAGCSDGDDGPGPETVTAPRDGESPSEPDSPSASRSPGAGGSQSDSSPGPGAGRTVSVVGTAATGLEAPWGLGFLPDGRAVVTERDTREVLLVDPSGNGDPESAGVVEQAVPGGEGGLLGVAVSPNFDRDRMLYFYTTRAEDNAVLRAPLGRDDRLGSFETVLDGIPKGEIHNGGRLRFGPDGYLYVATGETGATDLAQDGSSLGGKILRITPDGRPAPGNPDPDSPVWTRGHRNVQGLAFDEQKRLWASEFGPDKDDELNFIRAGKGYGWPDVTGVDGLDRHANPVRTWPTEENSPSGITVADNAVWMAALRGERLWEIPITKLVGEDENPLTGTPRIWYEGEYGRLRSVVTAPDGTLWLVTGNTDGRGDPRSEDDRILQLRVAEGSAATGDTAPKADDATSETAPSSPAPTP